MTNGEPAAERERLADVYRGYAQREAADHRWTLENPGNREMLRERLEWSKRLLARARLSPIQRVLDLGCGSGSRLPPLRPSLLVGLDILEQRVQLSREAGLHNGYLCADGATLPLATDSIDLVAMSTVLSSVLNSSLRRAIAQETDRVLREGGAILWYDFRAPNRGNRHTLRVARRELRALFPDYRMFLRSVTVAPPLVRRLGGTAVWSYPLLATIPLLRTHLCGALVKPEGSKSDPGRSRNLSRASGIRNPN